jgi:hypothetical protein
MKGGTIKTVEQITFDCSEGNVYVNHILTYDKGDNILQNSSQSRELSAPPGSMYRTLGRKMCQIVK